MVALQGAGAAVAVAQHPKSQVGAQKEVEAAPPAHQQRQGGAAEPGRVGKGQGDGGAPPGDVDSL